MMQYIDPTHSHDARISKMWKVLVFFLVFFKKIYHCCLGLEQLSVTYNDILTQIPNWTSTPSDNGLKIEKNWMGMGRTDVSHARKIAVWRMYCTTCVLFIRTSWERVDTKNIFYVLHLHISLFWEYFTSVAWRKNDIAL